VTWPRAAERWLDISDTTGIDCMQLLTIFFLVLFAENNNTPSLVRFNNLMNSSVVSNSPVSVKRILAILKLMF